MHFFCRWSTCRLSASPALAVSSKIPKSSLGTGRRAGEQWSMASVSCVTPKTRHLLRESPDEARCSEIITPWCEELSSKWSKSCKNSCARVYIRSWWRVGLSTDTLHIYIIRLIFETWYHHIWYGWLISVLPELLREFAPPQCPHLRVGKGCQVDVNWNDKLSGEYWVVQNGWDTVISYSDIRWWLPNDSGNLWHSVTLCSECHCHQTGESLTSRIRHYLGSRDLIPLVFLLKSPKSPPN